MNKFLDSAAIALDAIWSAKLRSFMTVLGNIVAVTSIIAVVSLIQGLNASVKTAILNQAGADSFNIQQFPVTRSDDEFDKVRNNPRITMADIARFGAIQRTGGRRDGRLQRRRPHYRSATSRSTRRAIQGVTGEYIDFSTFDAERGRLMSPTEVDSSAPGHGDRLADRRPPVRRQRPAREDHPDRGRALPRRRRQREEGFAARPAAGRIRGDSARSVSDDVRIAAAAVGVGEAARRRPDLRRRWTKRCSPCASRDGSSRGRRTTSAS